MRVRLDLAYDGSRFAGWARQPGQRTVQGVVEDALAVLVRNPVQLTVAGRTDAGVHATGQVAHVDVPDTATKLELRRINGVLEEDVRVRNLTFVSDAFDARFAALARHYAYRVTDAVADPLRRVDTVTWPAPLDAGAMHDAAQLLVGEHDFAAFCKRREGATTVRRLKHLEVGRSGGLVIAHVSADAFCHSMVRSLMGALLAVGVGKRERSWPASLLQRSERASEVAVAPPHGLTLVAVDYPHGDDALLARQAETRQLRG